MSGLGRDELVTFLAAVELGSFNAASYRLGLTRSAVSRRIDAMEQQLGVKLFDRSTKHLKCTEAGNLLRARAAKIMEDFKSVEAEISLFGGRPRGEIRVICAVMIGLRRLIPIVANFMRTHPEVNVLVNLTDVERDANLERHDIFIAWGELEDSSLIVSKIGSARQRICASNEYIAQFGEPNHPKELAGHNCILIGAPGVNRNQWKFESDSGVEILTVTGNFVTNGGDAAYEAVRSGIGVGRVTQFAGDDLSARSDIKVILKDHECLESTPIFALFRRSKVVSPSLKTFIEFLRREF